MPYNFNVTAIPHTASLIQIPLALAKRLSKMDTLVSRIAIPALVAFSGAMALSYVVGYTIRSAVLLVPRLLTLRARTIGTDILKIAKCAISFFALGLAFSIASMVLRKQVTNELELPSLSPAQAETSDEYKAALSILRATKKRSEIVGKDAMYSRVVLQQGTKQQVEILPSINECRAELARCDEDDTFIPQVDSGKLEAMKAAIFEALKKDLGRTCLSSTQQIFILNGERIAFPEGLSADQINDWAARTIDRIYTQIYNFYWKTEPDLTDDQRCQLTLLVMNNLHQASAAPCYAKIQTLNNADLGYHQDTTKGIWRLELTISEKTFLSRKRLAIANTYSQPLTTMRAITARADVIDRNADRRNEKNLELAKAQAFAATKAYLERESDEEALSEIDDDKVESETLWDDAGSTVSNVTSVSVNGDESVLKDVRKNLVSVGKPSDSSFSARIENFSIFQVETVPCRVENRTVYRDKVRGPEPIKPLVQERAPDESFAVATATTKIDFLAPHASTMKLKIVIK